MPIWWARLLRPKNRLRDRHCHLRSRADVLCVGWLVMASRDGMEFSKGCRQELGGAVAPNKSGSLLSIPLVWSGVVNSCRWRAGRRGDVTTTLVSATSDVAADAEIRGAGKLIGRGFTRRVNVELGYPYGPLGLTGHAIPCAVWGSGRWRQSRHTRRRTRGGRDGSVC